MAMSISNVMMPPRSSSLSRVHCIDQAIGATPKLSWTWYLFPPVTTATGTVTVLCSEQSSGCESKPWHPDGT